MIKTIKSLKDVENFAKSLAAEGTVFHPDDDFSDYVTTDTNELAFSKEEAQQRNLLMEKCFEICSKENVDIYNFMLEIYLKETGMDTFIPLPSRVNQS